MVAACKHSFSERGCSGRPCMRCAEMRLGRSRLCAHVSQASRRDCRRLVLVPGEEWSAVLCMPAPSQIGGLTTLAGPTEGEAGSGCRGRRASSPVETWCLMSASTAWQRLAG